MTKNFRDTPPEVPTKEEAYLEYVENTALELNQGFWGYPTFQIESDSRGNPKIRLVDDDFGMGDDDDFF